MSKRKMIRFVCSDCGSDDVLIDAWAQWNKRTQKMELVETFDKGHFCNACAEPCSTDYVEMTQEEVDKMLADMSDEEMDRAMNKLDAADFKGVHD